MMQQNKSSRKPRFGISGSLGTLLLLIAFICYYAAKWYVDTYGQIGFDSVLYTLFSDLSGVSSDLMASYLEKGLLPAIFCTVLVSILLFFPLRRWIALRLFDNFKLRLYPLHRGVAVVLSVLLSAVLFFRAAVNVELTDYIYNLQHPSVLYQQEYRDPDSVKIAFPEEKRNLIYIYLESMEISYLSTEQGGALPYDLIPELYSLAQENVNFSHNEDVGGFRCTSGTTWTIGAMVGQTAGIPLKTPPGLSGNDYGLDGNFLPGVTGITDVLKDNGYYQALMFGSDANFGGRLQYYTRHGIDRVYDYHTAIEDGIIPEDYYVWWGMEDKFLFEYAKQELTDLAAMEQPFAFTMLTVDTHHIDGYKCEYCQDTYSEQYENVIRCASRQVSEFVQWLQQQSFYENTTIVIVGDHTSMDGGYFSRNVSSSYVSRVYNCFINPAETSSSTKNREFCTLDLFPTTLGAMGCSIEGNRLGLGTNLFSGVPTLIEEMGYAAFNQELGRFSTYYTDIFYKE